MRVLLIGGAHDGETREVDKDMRYLSVPVINTQRLYEFSFNEPTHELMRVDNYKREVLRSGSDEYFVFVCGDPSKLIEMLIAGYRKQK